MKALLLVFMATAAQAQDVGGWRETRWGMTEEQVIKAFPEANRLEKADPLPDGSCTVGITGYRIESVTLDVAFCFNQTGLKLVRLTTPLVVEPAHGAWFDSLERLLVEKYGPPTTSKYDRGLAVKTRERAWRFPSTMLRLLHTDIGGKSTIGLYYSPPSKEGQKL